MNAPHDDVAPEPSVIKVPYPLERLPAIWRGLRTRKKIYYLRQLPQDIQSIILNYIKRDHCLIQKLNHIVRLRIIRMKFSPCALIHPRTIKGYQLDAAMRTVRMVSKYSSVLSGHMLGEAQKVALNLLDSELATNDDRESINLLLKIER